MPSCCKSPRLSTWTQFSTIRPPWQRLRGGTSATKRRPSSRHDTDTPMPMPGGATMLVSGAGDGQHYDGGLALAALASAWEEKVRSWVYGICVTWI